MADFSTLRPAARVLLLGAIVGLLVTCGGESVSPSAGSGSPTPEPDPPVGPGDVAVDGIRVVCGENIELAECARRADSALNDSLEPPHPPVVRIVVTCDAELCDADEGFGQVIVHFNDGTRYVVDVGFGITTN